MLFYSAVAISVITFTFAHLMRSVLDDKKNCLVRENNLEFTPSHIKIIQTNESLIRPYTNEGLTSPLLLGESNSNNNNINTRYSHASSELFLFSPGGMSWIEFTKYIIHSKIIRILLFFRLIKVIRVKI